MTNYRFTDTRYRTRASLAGLLHNLAYEVANAPQGTEYHTIHLHSSTGTEWEVKVSTSAPMPGLVSVDDNGIAHSTEDNAAAWDALPDMDAVPF